MRRYTKLIPASLLICFACAWLVHIHLAVARLARAQALSEYVQAGISLRYAERNIGPPIAISPIERFKNTAIEQEFKIPESAVKIVEFELTFSSKCFAFVDANDLIVGVYWHDT